MNKIVIVLSIVMVLALGGMYYKVDKVATGLVETNANASTTLANMNQFAGQVVQAINNIDGRVKAVESKK